MCCLRTVLLYSGSRFESINLHCTLANLMPWSMQNCKTERHVLHIKFHSGLIPCFANEIINVEIATCFFVNAFGNEVLTEAFWSQENAYGATISKTKLRFGHLLKSTEE